MEDLLKDLIEYAIDKKAVTAGADYKGFDFEMFWQGIGKRDYFGGWGGAQFWENRSSGNPDSHR